VHPLWEGAGASLRKATANHGFKLNIDPQTRPAAGDRNKRREVCKMLLKASSAGIKIIRPKSQGPRPPKGIESEIPPMVLGWGEQPISSGRKMTTKGGPTGKTGRWIVFDPTEKGKKAVGAWADRGRERNTKKKKKDQKRKGEEREKKAKRKRKKRFVGPKPPVPQRLFKR